MLDLLDAETRVDAQWPFQRMRRASRQRIPIDRRRTARSGSHITILLDRQASLKNEVFRPKVW